MPLVLVLVQIVACVLAADLLSGLVHWLEDAYGQEDLPVLGSLVTQRNNLHHQSPAHFARFGYWHSSWLLIVLCAIVAAVALACSALTWQLALVLALGANANQVHKWTHRSRARNGHVVSWLMDARLIPSQRHHARHHSGTERTHYCVLTPHLNPLLDRVGLWRGLERAIEVLLGVRRRDPRAGRVSAPVREAAPLPCRRVRERLARLRRFRAASAALTARRSSRPPVPAAARWGSS